MKRVFEQLPQLRLIRKLGEGGMGAVYEVEDQRVQRRCALKVLKQHSAYDLMRFKREFRSIAMFHHPYLVRLFDLEQLADGQICFTMELIEGQNLWDVLVVGENPAALRAHASRMLEETPTTSKELGTQPIRRVRSSRNDSTVAMTTDGSRAPKAPVSVLANEQVELALAPEPPACDLVALYVVLAQILDALEFLHEQGIVHRDLKPDNILVDAQGQIRVLDFGVFERAESHDEMDRGLLRGTISYLAPEVIHGQSATRAVDLYALGCILHELLVGAVPFVGTMTNVIDAHLHMQPVRIDKLVLGLPDELVDVVAGLLDKDPARRPSISDIRKRLHLRKGANWNRVSSGPQAQVVGREDELRALEKVMEAVLHYDAKMVVVEGGSGLGKSALGNAFGERARAAGFLVMRGVCYERESIPYRALDATMDALALHLRQWKTTELQPLQDDLALVSSLFESFSAWKPREQSEPRRRRTIVRAEAFAAVRRVLMAVQERRPVLFLVDDLQWTDTDSVELLRAILQSPSVGRLMVVGLSRPVTGDADQLLSSLYESTGSERVALTPLSERASTQVLIAQLGSETPAPMLALLREHGGGNPFFLRQLAIACEQGALVRGSERLPTLDELVKARVDALSPDAQRVLQAACVVGTPTRYEVLEQVSRCESPFQRALDEVLGNGLLDVVFHPGTTEGRRIAYGVSHDGIRERVVDALAFNHVNELHFGFLQALESLPNPSIDALLLHAQAVNDSARVLRYARRAADQARLRLSYERASSLYALVLERLPRSAPAAERAEIAFLRGQVLLAMSDFRALKTEMQRGLNALGIRAPSTQAGKLLHVGRLVSQQLVRWISPTPIEQRPVTPTLQQAVLGLERLVEIHAVDNEPLDLVCSLMTMLDLTERMERTPSLARAYATASMVAVGVGLRELARRWQERSEQIAAMFPDDLDAHATVLLHGGVTLTGDGAWSRVVPALTESRSLFESHGHGERAIHAAAVLLMTRLLQGEIAPALEVLRELETRSERAGDSLRATLVRLAQALFALRSGELERAQVLLHSLRSRLSTNGHGLQQHLLWALEAQLASLRGDAQQARERVLVLCDAWRGPSGVAHESVAFAQATYAMLRLDPRDKQNARVGERLASIVRAYAWFVPIATPSALLLRAWNAHSVTAKERYLAAAQREAETRGLAYERSMALWELSRLQPEGSLSRAAYVQRAYAGFERCGGSMGRED